MVLETSVQYIHLMWLTAREDFSQDRILVHQNKSNRYVWVWLFIYILRSVLPSCFVPTRRFQKFH